jgi:predicted MFS family arabinose efflux permease
LDAHARERRVISLLVAVQFINILDFMMVMPLGPFFSEGLGLPSSSVGIIAGSYTAAASVSGLAGAFFLDRFDRKKALFWSMIGLVLGTAGGGLATGFGSLVTARVVAGLFGGPATSLCFSIISDVVPGERRGRAVGEVMSSFAIASIAGVPAGLWLASHGGWRVPFLAVGLLGVPVVFGASAWLPALRGHLETAKNAVAATNASLLRGDVLASYAMGAVAMAGGFVLIPNLPTHLQKNLGYPREEMWKLYLAGGLVSWLASRFLIGRLVDRFGSFKVSLASTVVLVANVYTTFFIAPTMSLIAAYMLFFFGMGLRNISFQTLTTKVPRPDERARFQSFQSATNHLATSLGAMVSSRLLHDMPDGRMEGMGSVATLFIAMHLLFPWLVLVVERHVKRRPAPVVAPEVEAA